LLAALAKERRQTRETNEERILAVGNRVVNVSFVDEVKDETYETMGDGVLKLGKNRKQWSQSLTISHGTEIGHGRAHTVHNALHNPASRATGATFPYDPSFINDSPDSSTNRISR
jgi:hypothetical protein